MSPVKFYGPSDEDPGEWFEWRDDEDGKVELLIRRIPKSVAAQIERRHLGRKFEVRYGRKHASQEFDREKQEAVRLDKACYCLLDSRGFELDPGPGGAAELAKVLGQEVKPREAVSVDGKWTEDLKRLVLGNLDVLVAFVGQKVDELVGLEEEEEAEASGN